MKITCLGGADEVGASSILVEIAGQRLLIDAGIRPSPKARWGLAGDQLPDLSQIDQAGGIDAVLVTHAHTDHTGCLELVCQQFPDIPIYTTPITVALTRVLHHDARRIMQSRYEEEGELPLFDEVAEQRLMSALESVPFHTRISLAEGLVFSFYPAGHIAGAAMIGLESDEGNILISGDIALTPQRTVDGAKPPPVSPDLLIIESTYGGRLHANRAIQERRLVETVAEVVTRGGKVLIPAFALGRAQELLLVMSEYRRQGILPEVTVWADGMVRAICQAYSSFPDALPLPLQERGANFFDAWIRPVEHGEQRNALIWQPEPAVIIASSGMLSGGPSQGYARALAGQPQHAILLTGYQDEESPGRRLQEIATRGSGTLRLGKDKVDVQCRMGTYSLSAHADESQIISLTEALNPTDVMLVHGEANARLSIAQALEERGRKVTLPVPGKPYLFRYDARPATKLIQPGIGAGRPLDVSSLWSALSSFTGSIFSLSDLRQAWWGKADTNAALQLEELQQALGQDDLYFIPNARRPGLYRLCPASQVELSLKRRSQLAAYPPLTGCWFIVRAATDRPAQLARCTSMAQDHLWAELETNATGTPERVYPEQILEVLGQEKPGQTVLEKYQLPIPGQPWMEPNQALALANRFFPPQARLRRCGYRLDQHALVLTFDFPEAAAKEYQAQISSLSDLTHWQVEITPETNQGALNSLASECLPAGWKIIKGPSIYREQKRVVISASPAEEPGDASAAALSSALQTSAARYQVISGYELEIILQQPVLNSTAAPTAVGLPWEINAAYTEIKRALAGSSLYRTSLKDNEIVLSFISPQVGSRYLQQIQELSQKIGWPLSINLQANQGAILESARLLLTQAGLAIHKGPSIFLERGEVAVTLTQEPAETEWKTVSTAFSQQTGFQLVFSYLAQKAPNRATPPVSIAKDIVEIPLGLIRLQSHQQNLDVNPERLKQAVERIARLGRISPPVKVRRSGNGYILLDGFYRLKAAQDLGMATIPAEIE